VRSGVLGLIFPAISSVISFTETVTYTREPGPFQSSSAFVFARYPSSRRFFSGVELYWRAPATQWWFVAMRPSGETNEALHPPSDTIAPMGWPVRSAKAFGSPRKPMAFSLGARSGICCGIHMPSSEAAGEAARMARTREGKRRRRKVMTIPPRRESIGVRAL
jgi:hypothetical protein